MLSPYSSRHVFCILFLALVLSRVVQCTLRKKGDPPEGIPNIPRDPYKAEEMTVDFLVLKACRTPKPSECLFYTKGLSDHARMLASLMDDTEPSHRIPDHKDLEFKLTIWDIWPALYFAEQDEKWNPFRDIMEPIPEIVGESLEDKGERFDESPMRAYFARMSTAMAVLCSKSAYVLTRDMDNIPVNGIWEQFERPTLMSAARDVEARIDQISILQLKNPPIIEKDPITKEPIVPLETLKNQIDLSTKIKFFWHRSPNNDGMYAAPYDASRLGPNTPIDVTSLPPNLDVGIPKVKPWRKGSKRRRNLITVGMGQRLNVTEAGPPSNSGSIEDDMEIACACGFKGNSHTMDNY